MDFKLFKRLGKRNGLRGFPSQWGAGQKGYTRAWRCRAGADRLLDNLCDEGFSRALTCLMGLEEPPKDAPHDLDPFKGIELQQKSRPTEVRRHLRSSKGNTDRGAEACPTRRASARPRNSAVRNIQRSGQYSSPTQMRGLKRSRNKWEMAGAQLRSRA